MLKFFNISEICITHRLYKKTGNWFKNSYRFVLNFLWMQEHQNCHLSTQVNLIQYFNFFQRTPHLSSSINLIIAQNEFKRQYAKLI